MAITIDSPDLPNETASTWVEDFGIAGYETIWQRQKLLVEKRLAGEIGDGILIGEHQPVITLGRGSQAENLLNPTIPVISIERGGDVTYHGPGQIIVYPIILLEEKRRDLHRHLRLLEQGVIDTLTGYGIKAIRNPGLTGVWVETQENSQSTLKKVCSIGVAVKRWVTYHGLSLNVNCDLSAYSQMNPCGLERSTMENISSFTSQPIDLPALKKELASQLINQLKQ